MKAWSGIHTAFVPHARRSSSRSAPALRSLVSIICGPPAYLRRAHSAL